MGYVGYKPASVPLTSADITDGIIVNADINTSAAIAKTKLNLAGTIGISDLSATGTASSSTFLRGDNTWGSAGATAGQVIQVLSANDSTQRTTTSTSYVTASNTLSVTITPASTANKILILATYGTSISSSGDGFFTVYRGATDLGAAAGYGFTYWNNSNVGGDMTFPDSLSYLDSPNTTSATTYQIYMKTTAGNTLRINAGSSRSTITCLEIKG